MINKDTILQYAKLYRLKPYQVEKEYFQHLLLFLIYSNTSALVFKGGTAIKKVYGLKRFSEDLDFTQIMEIELDQLFNKISKLLADGFGVRNEVKKMSIIEKVSSAYRFKIIGPLVTSEKQIEACYIYIDISKRELPKTRDIMKIDPLYQDLPDYTVIVMSREEILAEKVRAIMFREKPRDLYDLWYLLSHGVEIKASWIVEKMNYYDAVFSKEDFFKALKKYEKVWKSMSELVEDIPDYGSVIKLIKEKFNGV